MDTITNEIHAERTRLADMFDKLTDEQWNAPSLCAGWRVREVVAHMAMPFRISFPGFVVGMVRSGFSFNRYADRDARTVDLTVPQLIELWRANIETPWSPPGGGPAGALSHDVIHGLDITEALGLAGPPTERIATVLDHSDRKGLKYFGVDLDGRRLVATDADFTIGDGTDTPMPAKDILLAITGRRPIV